MDGLELNISNYSTLELFSLMGVTNIADCNVFSLKTQVQSKYKQLRAIPGMTDNDREKLLIFVQEVYQKLLEHIKIQKENELLVMEEANTLRVAEHKPMETIATFPQKYAAGVINPLEKRTINKIVNIDSLFRVNFYVSNSNTFDIMLPSPIKNVLSMKVKSLELPNCVYVFNVLNKTNQFQIIVNGCNYLVEVREGNYTGNELVDYLNQIVFASMMLPIVVSYDSKYERIVFASTEAGFGFGLDFTIPDYPNRSVTLNMGWIIGFRKPCYCFHEDYVISADMSHDIGFNADACYAGNVFRYLFLSVNEFKNNYNDTIVPVFTNNSTLAINNVLAILRHDTHRNMIVSGHSADLREYFGPVSIEKLRITLYDDFGRLAAINNADYSFQLELECLYNL